MTVIMLQLQVLKYNVVYLALLRIDFELLLSPAHKKVSAIKGLASCT